MKYFSTNNKDLRYGFKEAVIKGLAPDNGLFFPVSVPKLDKDFFYRLPELGLPEIGFEVARHFVGEDISDVDLERITKEVFNFPIPLVDVEDGIKTLELFHGPTCAFKDVGARFMSRCLGAFAKQTNEEITILVATSGDTGSAVASGFYGVEGVNVIILYPSGKVSEIQEQQLTTMGQNIIALEVDGTFDDCQALVKRAFADKELNLKMKLTSANSINIARLLPQSFYYFHAWAQLQPTNKKLIFSVPSGNYGNLTGGLLAKRMGLPIQTFIATTNVNRVVPDYIESGKYEPRPSVSTISNAMDVGSPSNFVRMMELYHESYSDIISDVLGVWFSDQETEAAILDTYQRKGYLMDPHGAIGYLGLKRFLNIQDEIGVFLETAHPAKFQNIVENIIQAKISIPKFLKDCMKKEKHSILIGKEFFDLKNFLMRT